MEKITPRQGSQGLDHIYIEFKKGNLPKGCIIADTKVNTSKLGMVENWSVTQMSFKWRSDRVNGIVIQYEDFISSLSAGEINYKTPSQKDIISASYPISEKSYYWRDADGSLYLHNGGDVHDVMKQTKIMKEYLGAVSNGNINSRNRLIQYNLSSSGDIIESVYEIIDDGETSIIKGKLLEQRNVPGKVAKEALESNSTVLSSLAQKYGISEKQLKKMHLSGEDYVEMINYTGKGKMPSGAKKACFYSYKNTIGYSVLLAVTFNLGTQLYKGNLSFEAINTTELIKNGLNAAGSATAFKLGRIASDKITNRIFKETSETISEKNLVIITKTTSKTAKKTAQKSVNKIIKEGIPSAIPSAMDFGIGFSIDGIRIMYNAINGQLAPSAVYQSLGRAAFVNFMPELVGYCLCFVPGVGPFIAPIADIGISIILELFIPEINNLTPSVLYSEIDNNPYIYNEWINKSYAQLTTRGDK